MIVTIHQPIHFPYMGFFQKMELADIFVLLDDVQFSKNEFYNRNKFKNTSGIDEWFTVPVEKKANGKLIKAGERFKNPNFANYLEQIIFEGSNFLYRGDLTDKIDDFKPHHINLNMNYNGGKRGRKSEEERKKLSKDLKFKVERKVFYLSFD